MFGKSKQIASLQTKIQQLVDENETLKRQAQNAEQRLRSQRHKYKEVWTQLSDSLENAIAHVIGPVDEETIRREAANTVARIKNAVSVRPEDVILEIGSGIGRVGMALAPQCRQWIGCDVSANMLAHSKDRLKAFENVQHVEISGYDLSPIADASVDLVYCTVVFMHLDEWDRYNYILEARRILKPGGRLLVDNFSLTTEEGWNVFETHRRIAPQERPAHISKASTVEELQIFLQKADFSQIVAQNNGIWAEAWGIKKMP